MNIHLITFGPQQKFVVWSFPSLEYSLKTSKGLIGIFETPEKAIGLAEKRRDPDKPISVAYDLNGTPIAIFDMGRQVMFTLPN